ncbi:DMT family transporter [Streptococcus merionis]|uniref:Cell wall surface protein n=1 Tax=Streptococcus merionis TaxID=400065 RepID=A0A239SNQ4_9STRE|nr:DMT family transporter [Streptococcus merionis]SNU87095.1 cell wall surface protein [Streptococcus merionis]
MIIWYLFPILMGASIASQSAINSRLTRYTLSPFLSSAFSFFVGLVFLLCLLLINREVPFIAFNELTSLPWWVWIGGFTAAFALTVNVLLFPILGSMQTSVLPILGQLLMGVIIDQFGLFYLSQNILNTRKLLGLMILFIGTLMATGVLAKSDRRNLPTKETKFKFWWQMLGIFAGILIAIQSATNAYLGREIGSPLQASFISFNIAFLVTVFICFITKVKFQTAIDTFKKAKGEEWVFTGGILGGSFVLVSSWLVPLIGTGNVIVISLFGQLVASTVIQQIGLFRSEVKKVKVGQLIGLLLMLIGIIIIRLK